MAMVYDTGPTDPFPLREYKLSMQAFLFPLGKLLFFFVAPKS